MQTWTKSGVRWQTARRSRSNTSRTCATAKPSLFGIRIAFGQFLLEGRIVSINIVEEVNVSVFLDDSSLVSDQHGNRRSKIYLYVIAALVHGVLNPFQIPIGVVAENPGGELGRFLRVDAPMADCPFFSGELLLALGSVLN